MLSLINRLFTTKPVQSTAAKRLRKAEKPIGSISSDPNPSQETSSKLRKRVKLVMVTKRNNNKYYNMTEDANGFFKAEYGRVGSLPMVTTYPITSWDRVLNSKLKKGYVNTSALFADEQNQTDFIPLSNPMIQALIDDLQSYAKRSIFQNYNVSASQVTIKQIAEAQRLLDQLVQQVGLNVDVTSFNDDLLRLYMIIPRRMTKVKSHLIEVPKDQNDLTKIENQLAEEQATLDVMRSQVEMSAGQETEKTNPQTILQALNLSIEPLEDPEMIGLVKKMMGRRAKHFYRAYKVVNHSTQSKFDKFLNQQANKRTALFWHGSRNENWLSILQSGLVLRPANAIVNGKMFGYGLYFADRCAKSFNYSSLSGSFWTRGNQSRGFLALYDVHVGHPLTIKRHQNWCTRLSMESLQKRGEYDSVFARGGFDLINNEYIVYRSEQCTVRYLIEIQ